MPNLNVAVSLPARRQLRRVALHIADRTATQPHANNIYDGAAPVAGGFSPPDPDGSPLSASGSGAGLVISSRNGSSHVSSSAHAHTDTHTTHIVMIVNQVSIHDSSDLSL